jgi:hypothetical protein
MSILKIIAFLVIWFFSISKINAEMGCMANSWELTKPFDNKEYHFVKCACPCTKQHKILADRGKCSQCGHFRHPRPHVFITYKDYVKATEKKSKTAKKS